MWCEKTKEKMERKKKREKTQRTKMNEIKKEREIPYKFRSARACGYCCCVVYPFLPQTTNLQSKTAKNARAVYLYRAAAGAGIGTAAVLLLLLYRWARLENMALVVVFGLFIGVVSATSEEPWSRVQPLHYKRHRNPKVSYRVA